MTDTDIFKLSNTVWSFLVIMWRSSIIRSRTINIPFRNVSRSTKNEEDSTPAMTIDRYRANRAKHEKAVNFWKKVFYFVCTPSIIILTGKVYISHHEEMKRFERPPGKLLKQWPWRKSHPHWGYNTPFFNPKVNYHPDIDGYDSDNVPETAKGAKQPDAAANIDQSPNDE